jgi:hypothetical protein
VGGGYHFASSNAKAEARYEFQIPKAGKYRLVAYWAPDEKRSTKTPLVLERQGKPALTLKLNQREASPDGAHSIGEFDFPAGSQAVVLKTEGADGAVHADAMQLIPVP